MTRQFSTPFSAPAGIFVDIRRRCGSRSRQTLGSLAIPRKPSFGKHGYHNFGECLRIFVAGLPVGPACLLWMLGLVWATPTFAQENPFATEPANAPAAAVSEALDAFGGVAPPTAPAAEPSTPLPKETITDPLVRALREAPPSTPKDMALAIQWMTRLGNWSEVSRLLQLVGNSNWSAEKTAEMAREGGSALWIRLGGQQELTPEQHAQISQILAAPARLARDPRWIDRWIDTLASQKPSERRYAQLKLHDSGSAAVERLSERLLGGDTKVAPIMLLGTAMEFGADGLEAMRAACFTADPARTARVLSAMAQWKGSEFNAELGAGLVSLRLSPEQQTALSDIVSKYRGALPSDAAIREYLANKFQLQLSEYQSKRVGQSKLRDFVWRPNSEGTKILRTEASLDQRALERLAQLAAHRVDSRSATQQDLAESTVVLLQRAYKVSPELDATSTARGMLVALPADVKSDIGLWQKVLTLSHEWQMHGAALKAVEALGRGIEVSESVVEQPLDSLSELLKDSRPAMRYLAFEAIANIDPQTPYWGAEKQLQTAIEMSRLGTGPMVLVIGLREAFRNAAEQQLKLLGAKVITTSSFREALRYLDEPQPVESILIVDRMAEQSVSAAVERLRHSRRGGALPIGVLTDDLDDFEAQRLAEIAGVVTSVLSREPEQMQRVMSQLEALLDTRPLSSADRARFALSASRFLAHITADPQRYHFYPLRQSAEVLATVQAELPVEVQLSLLAVSGTAASQEQLMRLAASGSHDKARRVAAAQAFKRSVRQYGVRMQRAAVGKSYDLYNELGPTDKVAVEAIGLVLDSIEAGAGEKEWPQVEPVQP